jgi:hypothetical protein
LLPRIHSLYQNGLCLALHGRHLLAYIQLLSNVGAAAVRVVVQLLTVEPQVVVAVVHMPNLTPMQLFLEIPIHIVLELAEMVRLVMVLQVVTLILLILQQY